MRTALALLLAIGLLAPVTRAADQLQTSPKPPISAENAHRVQFVAEVPRRVNRIIRGPQRGELILLDSGTPADVVDDAKFQTLRLLAKDRRPTDLAISPDGKYLAWTERDLKTYTVQETSGGKSFAIEVGGTPGHAGFSPDGKLLAIGYTSWNPMDLGAGYSEMRLYDGTGNLVRTLGRSGPGGLRPVFSPDGKTIAVSNRNHNTQLFDVATGELLHSLDKRMTQEVAFSPDGKWLAAGYVDGTVAVWDVATGMLWHLAPSGCEEIYAVDWSPKGDVLATSGRDGKIILWGADKFAKLKELDAPYWVIQVRFTADGTRLLSSSASDYTAKNDRKIVVWAVPEDAKK